MFLANCLKTKEDFQSSTLSVWVWISPIVLVAFTLVRAVMSHLKIQERDPLCSVQPGLTQQLECLFQAGIDQNASLRMALYLLTAVSIFVTAYRSSKQTTHGIIPASMFTAGLLFVALTVLLHHYQITIPGYVIGQVYASSRLAILVENPTWIWPLLTPVSIGLIYLRLKTSSVPKKIGFSVLGACLCIFLIKTQQRGAILAALWILFWLTVPVGICFAKKVKATILVLVSFGVSLLFALSFPKLTTQAIAHLLSYTTLSDRLLNEGLTTSRTDMWSFALKLLEGNWAFGFGHGSWYSEFSKRAIPAGIEAYDTAHNFFVQTLFELGIFHLALVLVSGFIVIFAAMLRSWRTDRMIFWTLLHALGLWLLILTVQEVDFIRSVFYFNSLCAGWLFSRSFHSSVGENQDNQIKLNCCWFKWGTRTCALVTFGFGIFLASKFSLGGYQFEAHFGSQYQQKVRWLRPKGTLGFFLNRDSLVPAYALYRVLATNSTEIEFKQRGSNWQQRNLSKDPAVESYVPVKDQLWYEPPILFKIPSYSEVYSRYLSVLLQWPPLITSIPLTQATGLLEWEKSPFDGLQIRWCGETCRIQVLGCSQSQDRILSLMAARPDINDSLPLLIQVTSSMDSYRIEFTEANQTKDIKVPEDGNLTLTTSGTLSTEQDPRLKGILLLKSTCQKSEVP